MADHTTPWHPGEPCWADITVTDLERSKKFYQDVFGWEYTGGEPEFGGYTNATVGGRTVAAMAPPMPGWDDQSAWVVYLGSDDIDKTHEAVKAAGGHPVMEPMQVGPFGKMGLWTDPTGALVGAWQGAEHQGFGVVDEPGSVAWCDLMSADFDKASAFFADAFGFAYEPMGEGYALYTVPTQPDRPAGGIGQAADGSTPGWNVCFHVDRIETALERIERAGGKTLGEPTDFEFGRFASASGPDGETFVVFTGKGDA
ncbi:VOC family protein [Granulicoccus sp. GXG6511]|uniref:VOC family protein n=1 Tax=Granulicoccus sp. GXG6511 TaxID=3381351 RepID=UPI003D7DCF3D